MSFVTLTVQADNETEEDTDDVKSEETTSPQGWALMGAVLGGVAGFILGPSGLIGSLVVLILGGVGAFIANEIDYQYHVKKDKTSPSNG